MSQQIVFTSYIPGALVGNNSLSKTLAAEVVTGLPIPTGAIPGQAFFLSEKWANQLSAFSINSAPLLQCHAGWYMVVQLDAGATAANISQGAIGAQLSLAAGRSDLTDMSHALQQGINPAIFLNAVTPGSWTIVQIAGDTSVQLAASQTTAVGSILLSNSVGLATVGSSNITVTTYPEIVGIAEQVIITPAGALTLTAVAASSGGSAVYTGTITGGGTNNYVGLYFVITGFVNGTNNSPAQGFLVTANTTTTLTLSNPSAVAETHAGTATSTNLVRAYVNLPFGGL
jgi:hypothetical protein